MKSLKNNPGKWVAGLGLLFLLSSLLSSCLKNGPAYNQPPFGFVYFVQASPSEPPIDLYFNANRVNTAPLNYGDRIPYFRAYTGLRTVGIYEHNGGTKLFTDSVTINDKLAYSIFLTYTSATFPGPSILFLTDSITRPATGYANLRFVNVSPDAPAVDLGIQDSSAFVSNIPFKGHSSFLPLAGGKNYNFEIRQHATGTVLASLPAAQINSGLVYTIWFHGLASTTLSDEKLQADIFINAFY
jgi:hypothetical protein